jgi:hypothetical protein
MAVVVKVCQTWTQLYYCSSWQNIQCIIFVCKKYYFDCLIKELGINDAPGNSTYTFTSISRKEIQEN